MLTEPQGKGQSETNEMGCAKCELKHQQDVKQEGFKARVRGAEQWRF